MRMPSKGQLKSLEKATQAYAANLDTVMDYLTGRGITKETAVAARLGAVKSPEPGHEIAVGRLCIPYINKIGVIGLKFRCVIGHDCKAEGCPKYVCPVGQEVYLYGVLDADDDAATLHLAEGELDRLVLRQVLNEPAVGLPGVNTWEAHHPWHFKNWPRVLSWADGDKAGVDMNKRLRKDVQNFESVPMPSGHDVTTLFLEQGADAIRRLAGQGEDE